MTSPDILADRLEKAISDYWETVGSSSSNLRQLAVSRIVIDNATAILAALRSSASAREVETISIPKELTPELRNILGMPNFVCAPYAHAFRKAGAEILAKAEAEQAFVLHWLLRKYQERGPDWRKAAGEELAAVIEKLKAAPPASPTTLVEPEAEGA